MAPRPRNGLSLCAGAEVIDRRGKQQAERARGGWCGPARSGPDMADAGCARGSIRGSEQNSGHQGNADQFINNSRQVYPPGPSDAAAWGSIIAMAPDLAPAVSFGDCKRFANHLAQMVAAGELAQEEAESRLCGLSDGLALRSRALKLLGNGVVPLEAGYAIRTLSIAHGLLPVDLAAGG